MPQQINIKELDKPKNAEVSDNIAWVGESFGFSKGRDTEGINAKVLEQAICIIAKEKSTSTEELAKKLGISVQKANYHLRSLIESGLLFREKKRIYLRQGSVNAAVEEMRIDANRVFDKISEISQEIDDELGIND